MQYCLCVRVLLRSFKLRSGTVFRSFSDTTKGFHLNRPMKTRAFAIYPILVAIAILTGIVFADTTPSQPPASKSKTKKKKKRSTARSAATKPVASAVKSAPKPLVGKVVPHSTSQHFFGTLSGPTARRRGTAYSECAEPNYADTTSR